MTSYDSINHEGGKLAPVAQDELPLIWKDHKDSNISSSSGSKEGGGTNY